VGTSFKHPLKNIPKTLTHLNWLTEQAVPLPQLPPNLQVLQLANEFKGELGSLPQSLVSLKAPGKCIQSAEYLPKSLTHLQLWADFTSPKSPWEPFSPSVSIVISEYQGPLDKLPQALVTQLELKYFTMINQDFPVESLQHFSALNHLILGDAFNRPISSLLPHSLQKLHFGANFDYPIDSLPPSMLEITFAAASSFNHPVDGLLPNNLPN
jgi:FNIP Repeat